MPRVEEIETTYLVPWGWSISRLVDADAESPSGTPEPRRVPGGAEYDGEPLSGYVHEQCRAVLLGEIGLRREVTVEGVHDTRVAIRRLRSTMRMFGSWFTEQRQDLARADDDLRWFARLLGEIRDVDVLGGDLDHALEKIAPELVMGPVHQELVEALSERRQVAVEAWLQADDDERYLRAMERAARWLATPPALGLGRRSLRRTGEKVLRRASKEAEERLRRAGNNDAGDHDGLHRARKATKRLRDAGDALVSVAPKAQRTAERAKKLQDLLGDHQDLVVRMGFLREHAARYGGRSGHNAFVYGLLHAQAEAAAEALRRKVAPR